MIEASFHGESDFAAVTTLWAFMEKHMKKAIPGLIEETENAMNSGDALLISTLLRIVRTRLRKSTRK